MRPTDLFLSHSSGDAEVARELRAFLEDAGYTCWMAPDDVTGTESWAEQILGAIDMSRAMLVLISANANRSPHVSREVNLALGRKRAVLPIRIENVPPEASLEYLLSLMQRIDAFPLPISNHRDRILRRLAAIVPVQVDRVPAPAQNTTEVVPTREEGSSPGKGGDATGVAGGAGAAALGPGSRIAGFTIESLLGEGGMATVYRAAQDEPKRAVALKVIRSDHATDPTYRQRFLVEKDALAALEHPSIVPIYAAGEADGRLYIAMRLVDGPELAGRLREAGPLSLPDTIRTLRPIADAIDYAHEMGIVHRDLKPSNIILDRRGRPYLTDFGLGKEVGGAAELSAPGVAVGTLEYMAPEQFSGQLDPALASRVDIYALGCVAFACLTGASPFRGSEPQHVMYGHLQGAVPDISALRSDLPAWVGGVLTQALAKNPADRYPTADAFINALAGAPAEHAVAAAAPAAPSAAVPPVAAAAPAGAPPAAEVGVRAIPPHAAAPTRTTRTPPAQAGLGAWVQAHTALAAGLGALMFLIAVGAGFVIAGAGGGSGASPGNSSGGAVASFATDAPPSVHGDPPSPSPSPPPTPTMPPSDPPTNPPTEPPTDPPTPTPDNAPPTGVSVSITKAVVYTAKVNLTLTATGATQMRLGSASSASGSCSFDGWQKYAGSISGWPISGGQAGTRWVCAQFRDAAKNPSPPVRDSVIFDRKPVAKSFTYDYGPGTTYHDSTCTNIKNSGGISLLLIPYIATDPDGNNTFDVVSVTRAGQSYTISPDGRSVYIYFTVTSNFAKTTLTFNFKVEDEHGGTDTGSFVLIVGPCP